MHIHVDGARTLADDNRLPGQPTLPVEDGSAFGAPTPENPLRVGIFRGPEGAEVLVGVLRCEGRTDNDLAIAGGADGAADFVVFKGDVVACVPFAGDFDELAAAVRAAGRIGSIGLSMPAGFDVGSPLTESGTLVVETTLAGLIKAVDGGFDVAEPGVDYATPADLEAIELKPGPKGDDGAPGSVWRDGSGPPADETGVDGDWYVEQTTADVYLKSSGVYSVSLNIKGPKGDPGPGVPPGGVVGQAMIKTGSADFAAGWGDLPSGGGTIDESDLVHKTGAETITGAKTFAGGAVVKGGLSVLNSVGAEVSGFDAAGLGFSDSLRFRFSQGVDLAAGTNVVRGGLVPFAGRISKILVKAWTNGASGGFSLQIKKNGSTSLLASPYSVASSDTTSKTITGLAVDSFAAGDWFSFDFSAVGAGVQEVEVLIVPLTGNR